MFEKDVDVEILMIKDLDEFKNDVNFKGMFCKGLSSWELMDVLSNMLGHI